MAKTGYLIVVYQDVNPSSPTYNQTREERTQSEEFCPSSAPAHWIEDTKYCELTENGMLTGYEITVYRDVEQLSSTYNQTIEEKELNPTECEADSSLPNWQNIGEPFCRQTVYLPGGLMGNDGYMIQQQQDMNEYSETADEIRDIPTEDLEHCPLPNTLPEWEVIYEACHIVKQDGQLMFDGTKDVVRIDRNQYSPSWNNNVPETVNIEDLVNCPPDIGVQYRWVVVEGQYECVGYDKHAVEKKQQSIDGGQTWVDVEPLQTRAGALIEANSEYCGYVPPIDYSTMYFTFEALEDGTFTFTGRNSNSLSYSIDDGQTWIPLASGTASPTVTTGNKIFWKGITTPDSSDYGQYGIGQFSSTGNFKVYGNIMSIVVGDNFENTSTISDYQFGNLLANTKVVNAENLILPSMTLRIWCYYSMFANCRNLTTAPQLPATTLADYCYYNMFFNCTSLVTAPALPATTLANECYAWMFQNCTSLKTAPALPATTLADGCYQGMLCGCTGLTTAPELPATTLRDFCYSQMFSGTNILPYCNNIDFTSQTVVASGGLKGLFSGTKVTDADLQRILPLDGNNRYCLPVTTLSSGCYSDMFYNCASLVTAPQLPATTLAKDCYVRMFQGCTSLTTAPVLPATTLTDGCYAYMFQYSSNLNSITCLATNISASGCTSSWVSGVAASGTFTKALNMYNWTTGTNGIPNGWTIQNQL